MSRQAWKVTMMAMLTAAAFSTVQASPEDGPKHEKAKDRILKKFDADGDGVLSETEKAAMTADRAATIAKYDTDKDGKLSETERAAIPKPGKGPGPDKKQCAGQPEE